MKIKTLKKICTILFLLIIFISIMTVNAFAANFSISDVLKQAQEFTKSGTNEEIEMSDLREAQGTTYSILMAAGVIVAVIGITVIGVRFILSAPEGRADIKERMIPFAVGTIVIFGGLGIWRIMVNLVQGIAP